ncbi:peptidase S41 [Streptomyces sp. SID5475]|nr:peptidase S41 [Streptomyces sp. SID5475]
MTQPSYLRYPHPHGELIAFTAEDDVWAAPLDGGRAWRVSADNMPVSHPRISPDGRHIAWTSTRDGSPEVHVAPVDGGPSRRLTYWGNARTAVRGWTPEGEVLAVTAAGQASLRRTWARAVPLDGGPARTLPYGPVGDVAYGPEGAVLLLSATMGRDASSWKRYRGGTAGKLWLDASGDGEFARIHAGLDGNIEQPLWAGGRIAFLSDHEGTGALYSSLPDGGDLRRHSPLDGFYARQATGDGTRVAYASAGELWLLDGLDDGAEPRRLDVRLDAEGEDALAIAPASGAEPGSGPRRIGTGRLGRVLDLAVAPDGGRIAVASHDGRVLLVERESGEIREVDRSEDGDADGLVFSPDSGWLAWSHPGPGALRQLKIANTADLSVSEATPLRFRDFSPAFTTDGRHLAFLSERAFDPIYDVHVFDLAFVGACRPHLITLAASTPSPFGPQRHGRPPTPERNDGDEGEGRAASSSGSSSSVPVTRVDLDGLADRIVPFPVEAARYSTLRAAEGGVLWLRHPLRGVLGSALAPDASGPSTALDRYDLVQQRLEHLADDADDYAVTGDGKRVLLSTGTKLRVVPADNKPGDDSDDNITVDLSRVRLTVDPAAEWRQMYAEAGRLMRDNFWRADLGGVDWDGVLERYRPVLDRVATHSDLIDLLWEVQGELGTSHAYVSPPGGWTDSTHRQGLLGADLARDEEGVWRVTRVLPSESSDPQARSPLAAPGVAVRAGDAILAVDGRPVDPQLGPGPLLVGAVGKPVELTVAPAGGGSPRHPVVVPIADEEPLRYHDWVTGRRAHVHETSGGRLGYLHVPDMVGSGWAQLHRDLRVEVVRDGLIVDVRENRGGHTSQLVVEKLARRIVGWDLPRGMRPFSYPQDAPRGPVVAVANEFSGSDGDIVNAAIKALGIGPVVGTRTWGGVIGIDSRYDLVDGTGVTQPKYATWMEGYGWGVENHGVDPDVEVVHTPQDSAAGRDPQLDEAVRIALAALAENPAKTPPELPPL